MSETQQLNETYRYRASQRMLEVSGKPPADIFDAGLRFALQEAKAMVEEEKYGKDDGFDEVFVRSLYVRLDAMLEEGK